MTDNFKRAHNVQSATLLFKDKFKESVSFDRIEQIMQTTILQAIIDHLNKDVYVSTDKNSSAVQLRDKS